MPVRAEARRLPEDAQKAGEAVRVGTGGRAPAEAGGRAGVRCGAGLASMPLFTSEALILRTYKLGEADRIVVFLTRDRGKRRGVARGARRPRSRFAGALEPLTRVGIAYFEKEQRELVSLNYAEPERSPLASRDPAACSYAEYFAELLDEWAPEGDPNEKLYRLGASTLDALAESVPIERLARYFEYWLLRLQGVYPSHRVCHRCARSLEDPDRSGAYLVPGDAVLICRRCAEQPGVLGTMRAAALSRDALGFLSAAATVAPEGLAELALGSSAARELEAVHRALITMHLEREPRSVRVLRELGRP